MSRQHFSICFFRQPKVQRDHLTCSRSTQVAEPGFTHTLFTAWLWLATHRTLHTQHLLTDLAARLETQPGSDNGNMFRIENAYCVFTPCRKDCFILEKILGLWDKQMQTYLHFYMLTHMVYLYLCSKTMDLWVNDRVTNAPNSVFTKIFMETSVSPVLSLSHSLNTRPHHRLLRGHATRTL